MNRRISVRAIALHNGKLLCVQQKPYNSMTKSMGGAWCLPGGNLDPGEALIPCIEREMIEETGVKPVVGNLLYIQQFLHGGKEHLEFFFYVTNAEDFLDIDLSKTTHGATEIEAVDFVDPKTTRILPKFLTTEPLAEHAESYSPAKIFSAMD